MNNPYLMIANNTLLTLAKLERSDHAKALAAVIASATTKGQEALRKRVQKLSVALPFDRKEVEFLTNADAWMKIEAAKSIGLAILENPAITIIERKTEDDKVTFTVTCALVPKEDWGA